MKSFKKLFIARMKMFYRQKQSLFWMLFFPIMFILIFGLFNFDKMSTSNIAIIDNANSEMSEQFVDNLKEVEVLEIQEDYTDENEGKEAVLEGDLDFVFVLPKNFSLPEVPSGEQVPPVQVPEQTPPSIPAVDPLTVYYDKTNIQLNGLIFGLLQQYMSGMNMQIANTPQVFAFETQEIESKNINYLDILVPGIIGMSLMQGGLFGIAMGIVTFKEKGTLRKLMSTPLKIKSFLMAFVLANLVISGLQMTFILLISIFVFKVNIFGSIPLMYFVGLIGQLIFLSLGFMVSGIAKTVDAAQGMIQVVSMPMMFLSGVFFSKEALPELVRNVVDYLPLTPFIEALRKIALQDAGLIDLKTELMFMCGWLVVAFVLALKLFKFERE